MPTEARPSLLERLDRIDRRWIFLMMALAVAGPILWVGVTGRTLPEKATPIVEDAFRAIDALPEGSRVLVAFDFDPASAGELQPMATAFVRHCALRRHRIYAMTLWAPGGPLIGATLGAVLDGDPHYRPGETYMDLGFQAGNEGVIKQMSSSIAKAYPNDARGTPIGQVPMMQGIERVADFDLLVCVSAGYPGAKEWVQYAVSPTLTGSGGRRLPFVAGTTGVQTPQLIPYYPVQMAGMLGAIKGAAEYESLVNSAYEAAHPGTVIEPRFREAQRRMAPQLVAHVLMVALIVAGNAIFLAGRRREAAA